MEFLAGAALAAVLIHSIGFAQVAEPLSEREKMMLQKITALEERLSALERKLLPAEPATPPVEAKPAEERTNPGSKDTTLSLYFDGHYTFNTNRPFGRANPLRAYDVTANNMSINQTGLVVERGVNLDAGRRWGYRMDLMYGQATETLQGGAANEPRPQVYRNLFQAYGTYVLPAGKGLTVDFGKWASALGPEGNYTKDQINYSRSYFFHFLPFYHMGLRATYPLNDKVSVTYWLVNGANQTEDFNGFQSQLGQAVMKPWKDVTWTVNYYAGREQRDLGAPVPRGRFHVIDTYAFWNVTEKLTLGGEFDAVWNRVEQNGPAQRLTGGAAYFRYQLTPRVYLGQRYARLHDRAGLFSGVSQNLNDVTSTIGIRPSDGFETRFEFRRDFSNVPYFLRREAGLLSSQQTTLSVGLLWWLGGKKGGW